jgi:enediyne biosynthesis protein E4
MCNETEKLQSLRLPYLGQHGWGSFSPIIAGIPAIMRALLPLGLFLPLFSAAYTAGPKNPAPQSLGPRFEDVAKQAGLTVSHISTPEKKCIVESMSGGAGLIDCDNEG